MLYMPCEVTLRNLQHFLFPVLFIFLTILTGCSQTQEKPEPRIYPPPPETPRFIFERSIRTSLDVREKGFMDRFKEVASGIKDIAQGLAKPYGVAVFQGRVYVTDTASSEIALFDFPAKKFKTFGQDGSNNIRKPTGINISSEGEVYVADNSGRRVMVYDAEGKYVRAIGGKAYLRRPAGVAISPDSSRLYVIDAGGVDDQDHHRLTIWDAKTGEFIKSVGKRGAKEGEFNLAVQVDTAPDGTIYVVDAGNFRIQAFTPEGEFLRTIGSIGVMSGQFSRPKGIGVDPDGNIYVVDTGFGNFQIFQPDGQLLLFIGDRGFAGGPGVYMLPAGLSVDEDGRVYVVDQYFKKVDVFRPAALKEDEGWLAKRNPEK